MKLKEKIIELKEDIQDINFSYLDDRNHFTCDELNEIICLKIDLLFKQHFPEFKKEICSSE